MSPKDKLKLKWHSRGKRKLRILYQGFDVDGAGQIIVPESIIIADQYQNELTRIYAHECKNIWKDVGKLLTEINRKSLLQHLIEYAQCATKNKQEDRDFLMT